MVRYMLDTNIVSALMLDPQGACAMRVRTLAEDTLCNGNPIGANDLWIASHALALKCVIVTDNVKDFARVPNLPVENWLRD
jgi:tRNA(fMet)-specific endonuclease VapC